MKKVISILLAAALVLSTAVFAVFAAGTPSGDGSGYREVLAEFIGQAEKLLNDSAFVPNDAERESLTHSLASAKTVYDYPASADEQLREAANHLKAQIESPLVRSMLAETARITQTALEIAGFALTTENIAVYTQAVGLYRSIIEQETALSLSDYESMSDQYRALTAEADAQFTPTAEDLRLLLGRAETISQQPERFAKDGFDLFLGAYRDAAAVSEKEEQASSEENEAAFRQLTKYAAYLRDEPDAPHYGKYGDVNCDGAVTLPDALQLQKALAKILVLTAGEQKYGDVDGDGKISVYDVLLMQQYIAKIIGRFPAEPTPGPVDIEDTTADDVPFAA